jgi:hypothetical protein
MNYEVPGGSTPRLDTALTHLAGALAIPVWVAMPLAPGWRWLLDREDTSWYPIMKLFRQRHPNDWPEVIEHLATALRTLANPHCAPSLEVAATG